jgi:hypothetical protein
MNQMTTPADPGNWAAMTAPVLCILRYFRERLDNLTADMITLMQAIDRNDLDALDELGAGIREFYGYPDPDDRDVPADAVSAEEMPVTAPM